VGTRDSVISATLNIVLLAVAAGVARAGPPVTVEMVDLQRYAGRWYEIAALPNFFQRNCVRDTTAEYRQRDDGLLGVTNSCVEADGRVNRAEGVARSADPSTNAKLEVSFVSLFGKHLFWGDYWIIGLGADYEYALVGTPSRRWGWILARDPRPPRQSIDTWLRLLGEQGYDPGAFVLTPQSERGRGASAGSTEMSPR
jgi:apolipoprotein D and lipocalin family protein